jgi:hypothetical protein
MTPAMKPKIATKPKTFTLSPNLFSPWLYFEF